MAEYEVYNNVTGRFVCGPIEGKQNAQTEADRLLAESGDAHFLRKVGAEAEAVEVVIEDGE